MPEYVDGFVVVVPANRIADYTKMSKQAAKVWMEYGALDYRENVSDDLEVDFGKTFTKLTKRQDGEVVVFAWITYKSKAQRNAVNKKVMADPRIAAMCNPESSPFDPKRMSYGGFKTIVKV
ncbi:DUF1428 domain-containing protein [Actomonas aquatica]|uniref:DUF1428 domain-containing protein n=1 Tax=Actomonas aquatica TaxID=2866162 RepID=A0ABZ1C7T7_9BACT|nr:DUF1428 domain-containing protein [Opitutus sp. WL0086]WRQ87455.1 DUF1428 domain-containing protein [Opitutus sp. WL0086]